MFRAVVTIFKADFIRKKEPEGFIEIFHDKKLTRT